MRTLLVVLLMICSSQLMLAQTFHFISMFDTNDEKIGTGMSTERLLVLNEMQTIAGYLEDFGFDSEFSEYYGDNCGHNNLMAAIDELEVEEQDVVVFYYGGHGARAYGNEQDRFPQMCLGEKSQAKWIPSSLVRNMIENKNPRLTIILTGCCNKEDAGVSIKSIVAQSNDYTSEANVDKSAFKKLFLESKGVVQMTSSKIGEYSWCTKDGSLFCLALLEVLNHVGQSNISPSWESVCQTIKGMVADLNIPTKEGVVKQTPDYIVDVEGCETGVENRHDTTIKRRINNIDYSLSQDLELLVDKSKSMDDRLNMVDRVLSKHFSIGAKVITIGRDMNTLVDYEDALTFLNRIVLSPYISKINVIEQEGEKNSLIKVHEVRTR